MTARIHPTAIVDPEAMLGADVTVEPYAIIGPRVTLGEGTVIGPRVVVEGHTTLGRNVQVGIGSVLGTAPQDLKYRGEDTRLEIGDDTVIREYVTVNRGTVASEATRVGPGCYLMAYVHVAHDCRLGREVVLANAVQMAGHVTLGDGAQVGGLVAIHQFTRIGTLAFVGGGSRVPQDVPPYCLTAGNPMRLYGINVEGLRRAGVDAPVRLALKRAYRRLFNSAVPRPLALDTVRRDLGGIPEVDRLVSFVESSQRGVLV